MNSYQVVILKEAAVDLESSIDWYEQQKIGLGLNFLLEFEGIADWLGHNPFLCQESFLFIRKALFPNYPYSIFYAVDEIGFRAEIIAVLHQRINPDEIKKRINFL
ncbi:MAG: type II toxin-antitoxin system RelE/ParE family toxin [Runella slithyformis]|nr:MAG: type II toxin-antitoxin system RelE/ParE family toxin [Runella slithyformis]TAF30943.1 MAG: type II toxin-antitoxin system RelE/ParE family toxin [Cytophagales bacterium]TAF96830.1 MAG: type II toxin-antitoxin system RelE/ParE family toxin [Runella sp.]TAG39842.1 MAG: type II toxin-antitoxin system RelE/ParE family toxin [Cytophagia bacterium]TAF48696.1 MAG: type II toxin-antitoxin system RelE/ParE family toxin [Runella slithyformis]